MVENQLTDYIELSKSDDFFGSSLSDTLFLLTDSTSLSARKSCTASGAWERWQHDRMDNKTRTFNTDSGFNHTPKLVAGKQPGIGAGQIDGDIFDREIVH